MKQKKQRKEMIDLIIVDIDGTLVYHQTVASANRLFLIYLHRLFGKEMEGKDMIRTKDAIVLSFKFLFSNFFSLFSKSMRWEYLKHVRKLFFVGLRLYLSNTYRGIINRLLPKSRLVSSESMIRRWARIVVSLDIPSSDYSSWDIERSDRPALVLLERIRKENPGVKIIGITQSFVIDDELRKTLNLSKIFSNNFLVKSGKIVGYTLSVKNGEDKLDIAKRISKNAKHVAIFIDNYDDLRLTEMDNVSLTIFKRKLGRFIVSENRISF
jgi:phosphoserine phosphatase